MPILKSQYICQGNVHIAVFRSLDLSRLEMQRTEGQVLGQNQRGLLNLNENNLDTNWTTRDQKLRGVTTRKGTDNRSIQHQWQDSGTQDWEALIYGTNEGANERYQGVINVRIRGES